MKRDLILEIKAIKSRSEFNSKYDYNSRLSEIEYALNEFIHYSGDFNQELLKYIPIATVACFEAFFRSTIKEIIDFGKPFSDNVAKYNHSKNIKLDFEVLAAVQSKVLTVGEFVSHILPYNNLQDINSNITALIEKDFLTEINRFHKKSIFDHVTNQSADFQKRSGEIFGSIQRTYELRHIFCHEFATNVKIDSDEVIKNYNNCKLFLDHVNNYVWELLYPDSPETQTDMNIQATEYFAKTEKELETLVSTIKKLSSDDDLLSNCNPALFDASMEQWKNYRELYAKYKSDHLLGGSIYPLLYSTELSHKTKEKIKSLESDFEILLRKNND